MIAVVALISLFIIVLMIGVVVVVVDHHQARQRARARRGYRAAASAIDLQHRSARRQMNNAAGQSWRNLAG